jgi:hypothetical protein
MKENKEERGSSRKERIVRIARKLSNAGENEK